MYKTVLAIGLVMIGRPVSAAPSYAPVDVDMFVEQVAEHSYYVKGEAGIATDNAGFISNAGFVVTNEGVVVFDALGSPSLGQLLRSKIAEITDQPVVKVVVSHYHADHIYGLQVFQDEGAEIIAPKGSYIYLNSAVAKERLEERRFSLEPWVNEDTRLVEPDRLIDGVLEFSLGTIDFRLDYLGEVHSDGDLTMYVAQDRVLYSGDIIFEGRVPYVGDANTKVWLETLKRLRSADLAALVPGHGPAASDPVGAVARTADYVGFLRETMGGAVENLQDFDSAYAEADWSRFENLPAFEAANRRNAYQVFLSLEAELLSN